jgi:hypothetical protein
MPEPCLTSEAGFRRSRGSGPSGLSMRGRGRAPAPPARLANAEYENARSSLRRGLYRKQRELAALEADSQHIRFFLPTMITGLLLTPEYARASLGVFPGDHAQAITKRLDRLAGAKQNPQGTHSLASASGQVCVTFGSTEVR